jgi:hypothetical protein
MSTKHNIPTLGATNKATGTHVIPRNANKKVVYICPECEKVLTWCNGKIKAPYFRHKVDTNPCNYYNHPSEAQVHKDAKRVMKMLLVSGNQCTMTRLCANPECKKKDEWEIPMLDDSSCVKLEHRFEHNGNTKIADVAYLYSDADSPENILGIFEIYNTHKTRCEDRPEPWFEVDARELIVSTNTLDWLSPNQNINIPCIRCEKCDVCSIEYEKQLKDIQIEADKQKAIQLKAKHQEAIDKAIRMEEKQEAEKQEAEKQEAIKKAIRQEAEKQEAEKQEAIPTEEEHQRQLKRLSWDNLNQQLWTHINANNPTSKELRLFKTIFNQTPQYKLWASQLIDTAAMFGRINVIQFAHENGCRLNKSTCNIAVEKGHLDCLMYAHEQGCPWDNEVCKNAALNGHLSCLQYAHEQGCPWDCSVIWNAATRGHIHCLTYAHENGCDWGDFSKMYVKNKLTNFECDDYVNIHCPELHTIPSLKLKQTVPTKDDHYYWKLFQK